jgi:hypothetical protein
MDPVEQPGERYEAGDENGSADHNRPGHVEEFMHFFPAPVRKFIAAGSCCAGVAALYLLSGWDHGWIPGVESPFVQASDFNKLKAENESMKSDLKEMYVLDIARAIRDLQAEMCEGWTRSKADLLEDLQYKYERRTGSRYPHTGCR